MKPDKKIQVRIWHEGSGSASVASFDDFQDAIEHLRVTSMEQPDGAETSSQDSTVA